MATITGKRSTANISSDQRKIDMSSKINLLDPDASKLTTLTRQLERRKTGNPQFSHLEDDLEPRFDAVNNGAGYNSSATSIVVDNGAYFAEHYLVHNTRTGENIRVTGVSTNTLTVVRGIGSTAAAMNDNDELLIVGVAQPEGDTSRPARSSNPTKVTNYTQIFRTPFDSTRTNLHSENQTTPHDWDYQANKAGIEHKRDIEEALLFGHPSEDTTTASSPRRTTGGALHFATQNITDAGGALTEAEFFGALRPVFRYGSSKKVALCSPLAVDVLNSFPRGKLQTEQGEQTFGLRVLNYVSPHGDLRVMTHWGLEGSKYGGYIIVLDADELAFRYLGNEKGSDDTHINTNIHARDYDGRKDEYLTEGGVQFGSPKKHGLITGITS